MFVEYQEQALERDMFRRTPLKIANGMFYTYHWARADIKQCQGS
jgi:hypothetical protein